MAHLMESSVQLRRVQGNEHLSAGADFFFSIRGEFHPHLATRIPNATLEMLAMEVHQYLQTRLQTLSIQESVQKIAHSESVPDGVEYLRLQPWDCKTSFQDRLTELQSYCSKTLPCKRKLHE